MSQGVVVLEGDKPADGTWVDVTPAAPVVDDAPAVPSAPLHPAIGIWKDRTDLPSDSVEASRLLREGMMRRNEKAQS